MFLEHLPIWAVAVLLWLFGSFVVLPAVLLAIVRYERWLIERRQARHVGDVEFAPSAARTHGSRRPVPPAVERRR